jgi:serine phosphatase RsbU (regulator of sigma subunit)
MPDLSDLDASVEIVPGSRLLVVTDGLTETRAPGGEFFGVGELVNLVVGAGALEPSRTVQEILARTVEFRQG